jgi:hypothetical protein
MLENYFIILIFFATIIILSIKKKNSKMAEYNKEEHKR